MSICLNSGAGLKKTRLRLRCDQLQPITPSRQQKLEDNFTLKKDRDTRVLSLIDFINCSKDPNLLPIDPNLPPIDSNLLPIDPNLPPIIYHNLPPPSSRSQSLS